MSVEMELGRWMDRQSSVWNVVRYKASNNTWHADCGRFWFNGGNFFDDGSNSESDLIEYLGPIELSPPPACADQAGTPVVSPVSTETAGEKLQRMRRQYNSMDREASIYSGLLAALDQAKSDLGELIRAMEKEHDL